MYSAFATHTPWRMRCHWFAGLVLLSSSVSTGLPGCQGPRGSIGSVCEGPADPGVGGRPGASGQGGSAEPAERLQRKDLREACPNDACEGEEPSVVALAAHPDGSLVLLLDGPHNVPLATVATVRILATGEAEQLARFPEVLRDVSLAPDGRIIGIAPSGDARVLGPLATEGHTLALSRRAPALASAMGPEGDFWIVFSTEPSSLTCFGRPFEAASKCIGSPVPGICSDRSVPDKVPSSDSSGDPSVGEGTPSRSAQPELVLARFDARGQVRWEAILPAADLGQTGNDGALMAPSRIISLVVDGNGTAYVSRAARTPPATVIVATDRQGETRYTRRFDGYARVVADASGATLLFAARDNVLSDTPLPAEASSPPVGTQAVLDLAPPGFRDATPLVDANLAGCLGILRLADDGATAWFWSGLFETLHTSGDTLLVQELDPSQTRVVDPSVAHTFPPEQPPPRIARTYRLRNDGRGQGAYDLPHLPRGKTAVDALGQVYLVDGISGAYLDVYQVPQ